MSEQWTTEVSADQPAQSEQGVDVVEQADVPVDVEQADVALDVAVDDDDHDV